MKKDIYEYITSSESNYLKPIEIEDGWSWNMKEHLRRSFLYKNSQFEEKNDNRELRPFKNIVRPVLNVAYRTEGFDVKDIELYVNNKDLYYKSFLVRKFHEKWALENELDTFIDDMVESYVDYGAALVRKTGNAKPEVIDLRSLAFCNQTDLINNPFAILHKYSASELREQEKWDQDAIDFVIKQAEKEGDDEIEVYEVHGVLPSEFLGEGEGEFTPQIQVVTYYKKDGNNKIGITLFKKREPKLPFKLLTRDKVSMRALGFGGVEELFDAQTWTNFSEIQIMEMLHSAAKTLFKSSDPGFKTRNNLANVESGEVLVLNQGNDIAQLDTYPRNLNVFNDALDRWEQTASTIGSASEGMLGESPSSGTPFKLFEAQQMEAKGMHKYRQGKIAVFMDEIYRDWILPYFQKEIAKGGEFLATLSSDELLEVAEQIVENAINKEQTERVLNGKLPLSEEEKALQQQQIREKFTKSNKKFIEILKDELKDTPLGVMTNIAGKQKNLALLTDKIVNVLRQFISTPQLRQDPEMVKLLNTILESSGMSPIMFGAGPLAQPAPVGGETGGLQQLGETVREQQTQ